jgi:hypothetical protein
LMLLPLYAYSSETPEYSCTAHVVEFKVPSRSSLTLLSKMYV